MLFLSNFRSPSPLRPLLLALVLLLPSLAHAANNSEESNAADSSPKDSASQYQLAQAYELGVGAPQNIDDAFYWYSQSADNGNADAQFRLAELYLAGMDGKPDNKLALEWFIKAALQGNKRATVEIAKLYESSSERELLSPLDAAQLWYEAALPDNPDAEDGYNRVLEAQFNQQRAKQISSIEQLDEGIGSEIDNSQGLPQQIQSNQVQSNLSSSNLSSSNLSSSNLFSSNLSGSYYMIGTALALLIVIVSIGATLMISRKREMLKSSDLGTQKQVLKTQLSEKNRTIKQQKRQLQSMFNELKKQKVQKSSNNLQLACALFGYTPSSIPNQKSIKVRYKQLSKIYHPDAQGCDEEMKRLNSALKTILQSVTKS
ncbi:J domain-containing protein [Vibrio chagasii]|uniref:J domain-containing protein n=1 Tax=Vibrio chagasii TaxID=170679 RepID=A0A7Y4DQI7_9VIBR|nr:J domain-containing protein [Vibrio chagasii]NOH32468.1 J domain-containing protein [Vibrio chagasii]